MGGTWDLFRYPGIRSDSDMFTLGYSFRPWEEAKAIADGPAIRKYIHETAHEYGIDQKIRYGHRSCAPSGRATDARWTVDAERTDTGDTVQFTCNFFFPCTGYYHYYEPYSPEFDGDRAIRGPDHPPAALARGPRLRRQARGRDRQRRDRGDDRAGDGGPRRARDDAPALAQLHRLAAGRGPDRQGRRRAFCRRGSHTRSCAGRTRC